MCPKLIFKNSLFGLKSLGIAGCCFIATSHTTSKTFYIFFLSLRQAATEVDNFLLSGLSVSM